MVGPNYICQIQNRNTFNNRSFTLQGPNTPAAVFIYALMCQMDGHQHGANCVGVRPALVLPVRPAASCVEEDVAAAPRTRSGLLMEKERRRLH